VLNVIEQCVNVIKIDHVQRSWYKTGYPQLHAWIFDLNNGLLKELEINFSEHIKNFRSIYDLKSVENK
jgi:carbonic anhydrase